MLTHLKVNKLKYSLSRELQLLAWDVLSNHALLLFNRASTKYLFYAFENVEYVHTRVRH